MEKPLPALSYHRAVLDTPGSLTVRAVFDHAWHLENVVGHVVTVTTASYNGPLGIRVGSLPHRAIRPATRGRIARDDLTAGSVRVDLGAAQPWLPVYDGPPLSINQLETDLRQVAVMVTDRRGKPNGPAWLARWSSAMDGLCRALATVDETKACDHAFRLLGLGSGLTPAGDDLLCGLLAGLHVLGLRHPAYRGRCADLRTGLSGAINRTAPARTTTLSRTLLYYAGQGVTAEPLLTVLWSLGSGGSLAGLDALLAIGHSSGSDMLAGAYLAATTILAWEDIGDVALACPA